MMQTAWCVYHILAHAALAVADLEIYRVYRYFKMTETQTSQFIEERRVLQLEFASSSSASSRFSRCS